ncbi:glycoside hydrolase family 6 protein [Microlunatus flavus]|uniref:Glucanase n=1 Tax=Microlunatus flavus TaxID=1036181 RepID=A0A1H9DIM4_9ACTN|nr:glycoside hydrolase family 6 protein [Microlunatus flavus]SEQ13314.1 endoglucanase [Microlunatus flavus]
MTHPTLRRGAAALAGAALLAAAPFATVTASAVTARPLSGKTHFYVPPAADGAKEQIDRLWDHGRDRAAALIKAEVSTPQAVWFTDGTPKQVRKAVRKVSDKAAKKKAVPTLVVYNVPGRDCSQYSSGGAGSDAAYRAWIDGFAKGLRNKQKVVVVVEPDGLTNLPADCPGAYPGQDAGTFPNPEPGTLTAGRIADIAYAGQVIRKANRKALVYLDSGHSAWKSVADATARLSAAGVRDVQGFSLNVSNYQFTPNLSEYGTWISSCLALHPDAATTTPTDCGDQYYSGGPANGNVGVALDPQQVWSATASDPTANTSGIDSRYAAELQAAGVKPKAHFVVDTSRNGRGPWVPAAGTTYPDPQVWCNPPERGLGERPKGHPAKAYPQLDAYLWIKTPGQSDGQCNRGVAGSTTDPEWNGRTDPAAGAWFGKQALQLARLASPKLEIKR